MAPWNSRAGFYDWRGRQYAVGDTASTEAITPQTPQTNDVGELLARSGSQGPGFLFQRGESDLPCEQATKHIPIAARMTPNFSPYKERVVL